MNEFLSCFLILLNILIGLIESQCTANAATNSYENCHYDGDVPIPFLNGGTTDANISGCSFKNVKNYQFLNGNRNLLVEYCVLFVFKFIIINLAIL
jgi:hypothetical protein